MVSKLKGDLPNIVYLDGTKPGASYEGLMRNSDYIFMYTGHMAHKVSYLCHGTIRRYRLAADYLPKITNIPAIEKAMLDSLKSE